MKQIAILGYGKEGKAAADFLTKRGHQVTVVDKDISKVKGLPSLEEGSDLSSFDYVVRSPSFSPNKIDHPDVRSVTNMFFNEFSGKIIGVTGTKGKGTTSTLIHRILKSSGLDSHLVGNIGVPAIEILDDLSDESVVIYEISSFQLWDINKSPHVAVVLMIESDHLDIHEDFTDYLDAKANIVRFQTENDYVIHHPDNKNTLRVIAEAKSVKIPYLKPPGAYVENGYIFIENKKICSVDEVGLIGEHNLENICAAISSAWIFTDNIEAITRAVRAFKGLEHRLELVEQVDGIDFYNDSFSAATPSAIAAIKAFERPIVVILGGSDKGADYKDVAVAAKQSTLKHALLIGQTADNIAQAFKEEGLSNYTITDANNMNQIVDQAKQLTTEGDVVVLSPGSASFDMFENYIDRGLKFKEAVHELKTTDK